MPSTGRTLNELHTVGEIYPVVETDQFIRNYGSVATCYLL